MTQDPVEKRFSDIRTLTPTERLQRIVDTLAQITRQAGWEENNNSEWLGPQFSLIEDIAAYGMFPHVKRKLPWTSGPI